jgi:pterin-4a-carbinolamine dehydratase
LEISLTSHDEGGITDKDFKMAKAIEKALKWQVNFK